MASKLEEKEKQKLEQPEAVAKKPSAKPKKAKDDDDNNDEILGKAYDGRLVRRFAGYLAPYKWTVIFALSMVLLTAMADLAGPFLTKIAIDNFIAVGDRNGLLVILLLYLGFLVFGFALRYWQNYLMQSVGQHLMYDLRMAIYKRVETLSLNFFDRTPVGSLISRLTSDVDALNELVTTGLVSMLGNVVTLLAVMGVMFWLDWRLALIAFAVLPVMIFCAFLLQNQMRTSFRQVRARLAKINAFLNENINGMLIVQLFNREKRAYNQFDGLNRSFYDAAITSSFVFALFFPIINVLSAVAIAGLIWIGGANALDGVITFGTLAAFLQYIRLAFDPVLELAEKYQILQAAMVASERIFKILDEQPVITDPPNPVQFEGQFRGDIEFRNVHFSYLPDEPVLRNVSFKIPAGRSVAIVGATGAGKTSIISLMVRFYDVQQGQILVDGLDVKTVRQAELRRHIGIVLQDPVLFSGTIASNIRLLDESISDERVHQAAEFVNAAQFINKLDDGYDHEIKERGANLSGGQRQLLAFARAIAYNQEVLLVLDEATSSVDTENEALIQEALDKLMKGRTSIIIAHRLSTIRNVDEIIVLHKGQIVEQGSHEDLLTRRGFYYRLYELQYQDQEVAN